MEGDVRQLEQDSIDQGFQGHVGGGVGKQDQPPLLFWCMLSCCTLAAVRASPGDDETASTPSLLQDLREKLLPQKVMLCSSLTLLPRTQ